MPAAGRQEEPPLLLWSVKRASEPQNGALGIMLERVTECIWGAFLAAQVITALLRALRSLPARNLSSLKAPHESAPRCLCGQLGKERAFPFAISQAGCICPVSPGRRVSLPEPRLSLHCCSRAQPQPIRKTRTLQSPLKGGFTNGKKKGASRPP